MSAVRAIPQHKKRRRSRLLTTTSVFLPKIIVRAIILPRSGVLRPPAKISDRRRSRQQKFIINGTVSDYKLTVKQETINRVRPLKKYLPKSIAVANPLLPAPSLSSNQTPDRLSAAAPGIERIPAETSAVAGS
jgi:hypothetical protein